MSRTSKRRATSHAIGERLARLRQQIAAAAAVLFDREAELADLRAEVLAFQAQYDAQVGHKVAELEEIEAQIERCREQIDQYRKWGPKGPPHMRAGAAYVPVEEQYKRAWQRPEAGTASPRSAPPLAGPLDAATEARVKKLYRQLCRRFHPDLTQEPKERAWRTKVMAAVNAAYADRSLAELQALAAKPDHVLEVKARTDEQRLTALRDELERVRRRLGLGRWSRRSASWRTARRCR